MLAWSKFKHRISYDKARDLLTKLGTSWAAFQKFGNIKEDALSTPAHVLAAWELLQVMQAALTDEVDMLVRAKRDEPVWLRAGAWSVVVESTCWFCLVRAQAVILEGPLGFATQTEVVRVLREQRRLQRRKARTPTVFVSNLHNSMRAVSSRA